MKKITLAITAELMAQLGISDGADDMAVAHAIKNLSIKAGKVDTVTAQLTTAQTRNTELEGEVKALKNAANTEQVTAMLATALEDKKITVELSAQLAKDYAENPTGLKVVLEGMGMYSSVVGQIQQTAKTDLSKYEGKGWDELWESGQMEAFKKASPEGYKKLYKETFGEEPK